MASATPSLEIIPILTASGKMSLKIASSCASTKFGGMSSTPNTPREFCAVSAVIALIANILCALIVLISAWMPAPPPLSEPAIVRIFLIKSL